MDVFGLLLDQRDEPQQRGVDADVLEWLNQGKPAEVRLLKFDAWLRRELAARIDWTWTGAQRERRIEQCRHHLERVVLELWRRGWMLDGKRLAAHLTALLDAVGKYQRAGKVADFWPYFRAAVDRYVGGNAEELRAEAMRAGSHVNQLLGALGIANGPKAPTLPELVAKRAAEVETAKAETLREKLARARRRNTACKADADQPQLL